MARKNKNAGTKRLRRPPKGRAHAPARKHMLDLIEQPKYDPRHDLPYVRVGERVREREEQ